MGGSEGWGGGRDREAGNGMDDTTRDRCKWTELIGWRKEKCNQTTRGKNTDITQRGFKDVCFKEKNQLN